ncbi:MULTISPECIES: hypothetical protein [unclassified Crossiella]|uniref:hypothetical protein n=1 Tax=unclassified Crossiella TaxID=2620835 RepID=UPI001FFF6D15|nr:MULTISPECIES: hypothetical protein [unclassified Crossiella]MCK2239942.1 hypothetical protein [Crossiella sp. S99.2]MCK2252650.1 hypothetical protein [Crossiella sp. S99.1]
MSSNGMSADPDMIAYVGSQFRPIAQHLYQLGYGSEERLALLIAACGDDDMGREIQGQLLPTAKIIEEAGGSIGAAVENTGNVMSALALQLKAMERNNAANIGHGFKR